MIVERIDLIHKIPEAIIEPNVFGDRDNLEARFDYSMGALLKRPDISVSEKALSFEAINQIREELVGHFISVASDLGTLDLANGHLNRLFAHIMENYGESQKDIMVGGAKEFYQTTRFVLGPIWAAYVHDVLSRSDGNGTFLFAARDATPIYWAAQGMISPAYQHQYNIENSNFVHVDWNRWFMGQEDETDDHRKPLPFSHPLMKAFYEQMGFGTNQKVKIVEPGAWGSAANALRTVMPEQDFELYFLFSHMPEYIYGFLNQQAPDMNEKIFEMISDTAEAVPKPYLRPESLKIHDNIVVADLSNKIIDSPFMKVWSWAVNQGAYDAGLDFARGDAVKVKDHVEMIAQLSALSRQGKWTGVLPRNTMTWTEGENWRKNWKWGKIPPLK